MNITLIMTLTTVAIMIRYDDDVVVAGLNTFYEHGDEEGHVGKTTRKREVRKLVIRGNSTFAQITNG